MKELFKEEIRRINDSVDMSGKNEKGKNIVMRAYKFDGRLHYEQTLKLIKKGETHVVLKGDKGRKLKHHTRKKVFEFDKETREYFFTDRWYTAALVYNDKREVIHVYCNIAKPCIINESSVEFVDLDVDVIVRNGKVEIIDIDEFNENKETYGYGKDLERKVLETADLVADHIKRGIYPFTGDILKE